MKVRGLVVLVVQLLSVSFVFAQTTRLNGTVMDPSGAVVPGVTIKLLQGSNVIREGKTNDTGDFNLDVPSGDYKLEVVAENFKTIQQNLRLTTNMRPLRIILAVATVNATVDVNQTDDRVGLDDDANLTSTTLAGDRIKDLPEDEDALMAQLQALAGGAGAAGTQATFVVDGFSNGRVPPRDQIQQIIIDTNVFSAEGNGGPRIQIITKPGTGPWSGNINLNYNDQNLNARNAFDPTRPKKQQRTFITSYGGPVIPGKLTLRFNARTIQQEFEGNSILAVTPSGRVSQGIFTPNKNKNLNINGQLFLTQNNTLNFGGNYNTNEARNQGVGSFTLPERATNSKGHNWNLNLGDRAIVNTKLISELRFSMNRNENRQNPVTEAIAVNVLDAFNGGGAQNRTLRRGTSYNWGNTVRWTVTPKLNLQIGSESQYIRQFSSAETNYLGVFTFSSLDDYVAGTPVTFRKTTGDPAVHVNQLDFSTFIQADWRLNTKLNLGAGLRYQAQTNLGDYNNFGPTFQVAYQPRTGTVIRAGGRLSYQTFNIGNTESILRQDGLSHQVEIVILNPSYPDPFLNGGDSTNPKNTGSIRSKAGNLSAPYNMNSAVTLEQSLKKGWRVSTSIDVTRGLHLIRTRNLNAPYPGTPLSLDLFDQLNSRTSSVQVAARDEVDRMRPLYPNIGNIYQYESSASSFSKNLGFRIYTPNNFSIKGIGINGFAQYTLGWAFDDQSAVNQYDWRREWAHSSFDTRHRFLTNLNFRLPWSTTAGFFINSNSGRPYSITTGKDNNGDQALNDRPDGVLRNSLTGPGGYNISGNFTKTWALKHPEQRTTTAGNAGGVNPQQPIGIIGGPGGPVLIQGPPPSGAAALPGPKMSFNVSVNNLFNNVQLRGYSGVLTSPLFGKPIGAASPRTVTLGLGLTF